MTSQPIKWHGGKSYLAKWLHENAPPSINEDSEHGYSHRLTPFAGGLGELWLWSHEGISETVNDLNPLLSRFWDVLSNPILFDDFARRASATPFSERQWQKSRDICLSYHGVARCPVDIAVDFFIQFRQSRQGLGKDFATPTKRTRRGMNENVSAWLSAVEGLPECHERLKLVEVRCMPAVKFIRMYDHQRAFFYCDPPYVHSTRTSTGEYAHEMSEASHMELLDTLVGIEGKFMLSGYPSELYDETAFRHGWRCVKKEIDNKSSSKKTKDPRTECLWMNY